ncbi:reverse transcriptase domain-containing protein [Williamsia muralis]|uniref:reverse transcriptase domain-containing protein n=1 Tax=Williamsia marianensis TaxID=85044 RepID=UPI00117BE6A7|nr:reverse transcriptase domain-containing protein [Williamsia marianensis]
MTQLIACMMHILPGWKPDGSGHSRAQSHPEDKSMWGNIESDIYTLATAKIKSFEAYAKWVSDENGRRQKRTIGKPSPISAIRPEYWAHAPGHDPYHVRARQSTIAHSLTAKLRAGSYRPHSPSGYFVPKLGGGERLVSCFEIADEVVSRRLFTSLMSKNRARLSARAYAYRNDLTPHDALEYIASEFSRKQRIFVAEYDFRKFFDTIDQGNLLRLFDDLKLRVTSAERSIVEAFLSAPQPIVNPLPSLVHPGPRTRGIPQGTSVSLFLANVVVTPLDRRLESLGVGFVRYADDTLIWSHDYSSICRAVDELHAISKEIGAEINLSKSPGIHILTAENQAEMNSVTSVDYLGHTIRLTKLSMKSATERKILQRVDSLIYSNLLREPLNGTQNLARVSTEIDFDYVTFIWQLRRYLYGNLSESKLRKLESSTVPLMNFHGVMSYFPLVDDDEQLSNLDLAIISRTALALKKRSALLSPRLGYSAPPIWSLPKSELRYHVHKSPSSSNIDLRFPTLSIMSKVIRKAINTHGLGVVSGKVIGYNYKSN